MKRNIEIKIDKEHKTIPIIDNALFLVPVINGTIPNINPPRAIGIVKKYITNSSKRDMAPATIDIIPRAVFQPQVVYC